MISDGSCVELVFDVIYWFRVAPGLRLLRSLLRYNGLEIVFA